jgi:hypothetical protein
MAAAMGVAVPIPGVGADSGIPVPLTRVAATPEAAGSAIPGPLTRAAAIPAAAGSAIRGLPTRAAATPAAGEVMPRPIPDAAIRRREAIMAAAAIMAAGTMAGAAATTQDDFTQAGATIMEADSGHGRTSESGSGYPSAMVMTWVTGAAITTGMATGNRRPATRTCTWATDPV